MPSLLELRGVSKHYGGRHGGVADAMALADFSLHFDEARPRIVAVVGESGSGKTTLAQIVLGLLPATQGSVTYRSIALARLEAAQRKTFRREVQAILQDPFSAFNPFYTVDHALSQPLRRFGLARQRADRVAMMQEACRQVGLNPADTLGRYPHQLSGGQRQRLMVARALMLKPKIIVADEPVSMVDASLRATILENLALLRRSFGISVLYITHDLATAYHVADSVVVLYRGRVVEAGDVGQVMNTPRHPYTQLLIDSIAWPDLERKWGRLPLVEGAAPVLSGGCAFANRCPLAIELCSRSVPGLRASAVHQVAACHLLTEGELKSADWVAAMVLDSTSSPPSAQMPHGPIPRHPAAHP
jgi:oligopeptide/dipeptide ABC transporter ATP-binding protein